ncbi:MAG TPA: glycerol-3-phosphate dehydrogenase/oxidase [Anaerohalosphaeraceae bacterium]|jgi:glycerol-3-phosphate dehydrogenase|nr:glycerol-3-phosphate dehydrogenase/oxidase [Anaerohalosphaeraceae bacterium]HRT51463.1 glycerol-3-phosphate dehydrogenase/oxidase [Anaerohalosphaeraceae bacterium]HRT87510.1 glycerol-3-phosphate dehydrogenase/oxidase [Anaerohalosphaeraceae bacterium]
MKKRTDIWNDLKHDNTCDVLILGGGVNGAGVFRDLALQGVSCILVDKDDFSAGASSQSSRMIHGGLRYLENGEFKLVRESVIERNRLLRTAPHFVRPLKISIPVDSWLAGLIKSPLIFLGLPVKVGGRGALIIKMGLLFYDLITRKRRQTPRHYLLSKDKSLKDIPGLRTNIVCTATYWDAWISQAERLCIEMIEEACRVNPACRAINYVTAAKTAPAAVALTEQATGEEVTLHPKIVVNATGAWVDLTNRTLGIDSHFMGGTKGSHLVIYNKQLYDALGDRMVYYEHTDGRVCIAFRFMDKIIMGSTDIRIDNPDDAECDDAEIEYMMTTLRGVFPGLALSRDDIVFRFCGVRPLPASNVDYTGRVPRAHRLHITPPSAERNFPVYSMIGGKLTTFRAFAEQAADKILTQLGKTRTTSTEERPYLGAMDYPVDEDAKHVWISRVAAANNLAPERVATLLDRYGVIAETIAARPAAEHVPLAALSDYSVAEIRHIAENECIHHLTDLTRRRSIITLTGKANPKALEELAQIIAPSLTWRESRQQQEIEKAEEEATYGR